MKNLILLILNIASVGFASAQWFTPESGVSGAASDATGGAGAVRSGCSLPLAPQYLYCQQL